MIDLSLEADAQTTARSPREAILEACMMRLRPIMMTTLAALLGGLLPLIFGIGAATPRCAGHWASTIVGGLIGSQLR
ncbi:efflux RND transporter permease subunit [Pseudomonas aeruginosa]